MGQFLLKENEDTGDPREKTVRGTRRAWTEQGHVTGSKERGPRKSQELRELVVKMAGLGREKKKLGEGNENSGAEEV